MNNVASVTLQNEERVRALLAQCWAVQALLMLASLVLALLHAAVMDDFTMFLFDPGQSGWLILCMLLALASLMPLLVSVQEGMWFRRVNALLMALSAMQPVLHHGRHYLEGKLPDAGAVPEACALLVGLFGLVLALRWVALGRRTQADGARVVQ